MSELTRIRQYFISTADIEGITATQQMELVDRQIDEELPSGKGGVGIANGRRARALKRLAREYAAECDRAASLHSSFFHSVC